MAYKAKSITSKASSACKMNMGLVQGEADVQNSKAFVNYGSLVEKKINSGGGGTSSKAVTINSGDQSGGEDPTSESEETPPKTGQATDAVKIKD
tara:strand:+ start:163 stop:444 length:282 start_codon:yes stop_codon:yes gene_type:complete